MNERLRRILIFIIIVGTGTLLVFINLPLVIILPLIIMIGLILLILMGAIPLAELKSMATSRLRKGEKTPAPAAAVQKPAAKTAPPAPAQPPGKRLPFSLSSLFRKKEPAKAGTVPAPKPTTAAAPKSGITARIRALLLRQGAAPAQGKPEPPPKPSPAPAAGTKAGISRHFSSLLSSVKALGTILTTKKKDDPDRLKRIDSMLDRAVSEKVDTAPPPAPIPAPAMAAGGSGAAAAVPAPAGFGEDDPFLALSGDDLDVGLLDGIDDDAEARPSAAREEESPAGELSIPDLGEISQDGTESISLPSPESPPEDAALAAAADDILKANEADAGDLPALEGLESSGGDLGELDTLSLDSVDLDEEEDEDVPETGTGVPSPAPTPVRAAAPAASAPAPAAAPSSGKSDQSEMAAFAAASTGDDDMLSSLAADIKTVKKEQDISLLRELKDFRAPGTAIESELTDLYTALNAATERQKKVKPPPAKTAGKPAAGKRPQAR